MKSRLRFVWIALLPLVLATASLESEEVGKTPDAPPAIIEKNTPPELLTQVVNEREAVYQLISSGFLVAGASALAQPLRGLPADHPELIDTAYGSAQLLHYTVEYLMDGPTRTQFVQQSLNPDGHPIDRLIVAGYNIAIGQETPGKTLAAQDLLGCAATDNPFARIVSLFLLRTLIDITFPTLCGDVVHSSIRL